MTKIKIWIGLFLIVLFVCMAGIIWKRGTEIENLNGKLKEITSQLVIVQKENQLKISALEEREQSLINDNKELQNEYRKLSDLKKENCYYAAWADVALPADVSKLMLE